MSEELVIGLSRQALWTILLVAGPMLGFSLVVGVLVSLLQATTQIQEQTLTFIPKIAAVMLAILLWGPFMLAVMTQFSYEILVNIPFYIPMPGG